MEPEGSLPHSQVPKPVPILSQINLVHASPSHFLNIHLNIKFPSTPGSWKVASYPQISPPKPCIHLSPHTCHMSRPSHSSRLDHPNNIGLRVQIIKFLIMYFSPLPCYLVPFRPKYSSSAPYSQTPSAYVPPSSCETKFHTHTKQQVKIYENQPDNICARLALRILAKSEEICTKY